MDQTIFLTSFLAINVCDDLSSCKMWMSRAGMPIVPGLTWFKFPAVLPGILTHLPLLLSWQIA